MKINTYLSIGVIGLFSTFSITGIGDTNYNKYNCVENDTTGPLVCSNLAGVTDSGATEFADAGPSDCKARYFPENESTEEGEVETNIYCYGASESRTDGPIMVVDIAQYNNNNNSSNNITAGYITNGGGIAIIFDGYCFPTNTGDYTGDYTGLCLQLPPATNCAETTNIDYNSSTIVKTVTISCDSGLPLSLGGLCYVNGVATDACENISSNDDKTTCELTTDSTTLTCTSTTPTEPVH